MVPTLEKINKFQDFSMTSANGFPGLYSLNFMCSRI